MSTPSFGIRLNAYGMHGFASFSLGCAAGIATQKVKDYFFPNDKRSYSKYVARAVGFVVGTTMCACVAVNPKAQKMAISMIGGRVSHGVEIMTKEAWKVFKNDMRQLFSTPTSIISGIAGAALSSLGIFFCHAK